MDMTETSRAMSRLRSELVDGAGDSGDAFILNAGDIGLLASVDKLSAEDASRSVNEGATIAAHAQHVRYGLSLMNRWAAKGGNPFADAKWDEAGKTSEVDTVAWTDPRGSPSRGTSLVEDAAIAARGHRRRAHRMIASIAHLAYRLGAIRQISKAVRGPKEGTF
jgi:hypothetical protein